ncbi:MAG: TaqI-like C-terminal specificity domain-containing protein [bacterium]
MFKKKYPTVYSHLLGFQDSLKKRNIAETGKRYEWYALQRCAATYYSEFEKEKIIYPNMTKFLPFIFDAKGFFTNDKCFILTSDTISLRFLTGYFNSNISHYWIRNNCPELQGGTRELRKVFFENIPVPYVNDSIVSKIEFLVEQILELKKQNPDQEVSHLINQIDELFYKLYDLTEDEIKIIKGIADNHIKRN